MYSTLQKEHTTNIMNYPARVTDLFKTMPRTQMTDLLSLVTSKFHEQM